MEEGYGMIEWLKKAVFYEIYPQSFCDSNGDGIGDINGIISKLDYIKDLGADALWINPCFDSPFRDAGYDVRDYKLVAPRYGTNEDLYRLFDEAHSKGIKVLLDLVAGHTSEEHEWFKDSSKKDPERYAHRYVWTDDWIKGTAGYPYIGGECERNGTYMLNFFKCQPALNYGFLNPAESWQKGIDDPDCVETREAMTDIIRFWLMKGCDGFRVDMAFSLVKNDDEKKSGTCRVWREIFAPIREEFPNAVFVSEWGDPEPAILSAGFDMDFYLHREGNGYCSLLRDYDENGDRSYFKRAKNRDITPFLSEYLPWYSNVKDKGYICLATGNHDVRRAAFNLSADELKIAYACLFTLPGVPFIYYGDEIGMNYLDLPSKEGGYTRTGSRTPMQWDDGYNMGFSDAEEEDLYLPIDESEEAPSVEYLDTDENSLYHTVRRLLRLRKEMSDFDADSEFEVLCGRPDKPFAYRRGDAICIVNPSDSEALVKIASIEGKKQIFRIGNVLKYDTVLRVAPGTFAIYA